MRLNLGWLKLEYQRMPKFIGRHRTLAPSYVCGWWRGRCIFAFDVPKYGRER